jgi:thymidylate kinase
MRRAVIESIDGMGKSTAAQAAAQQISEAYPGKHIAVVDSTGVFGYNDGELTSHTWTNMEALEPHQTKSRLLAAAKLGTFTMARRMAEKRALRNSDLVIGVRDPFRVDPATYALVFGPSNVQNVSPVARLRFFDRFATAPHPDTIIHLHSETQKPNVDAYNGELDSHETPEKLAMIAEELPHVLEGYTRLFGSRIAQVEALRPASSDEVAAQIEPLIAPTNLVHFPTAVPGLLPDGYAAEMR